MRPGAGLITVQRVCPGCCLDPSRPGFPAAAARLDSRRLPPAPLSLSLPPSFCVSPPPSLPPPSSSPLPTSNLSRVSFPFLSPPFSPCSRSPAASFRPRLRPCLSPPCRCRCRMRQHSAARPSQPGNHPARVFTLDSAGLSESAASAEPSSIHRRARAAARRAGGRGSAACSRGRGPQTSESHAPPPLSLPLTASHSQKAPGPLLSELFNRRKHIFIGLRGKGSNLKAVDPSASSLPPTPLTRHRLGRSGLRTARACKSLQPRTSK